MIFRLLLFFTVSLSAHADFFQWLDSNGKQHFSDKPHSGAETLQLNPGYSYYLVNKVYDGDTILLSNGQKIRLLGINTPEVEGRNKSAQPGGEEAKQWLQAKLENQKVRLETDVEKKDKYGRLLAHIFRKDGKHINLELVQKGLAAINIHPPNLKYTEDLLKAQQSAEKDFLGIWKYKEYAVKPASDIEYSSFKGWQRVMGQITNIHHSRKYSYLDLSETFSLKIERKFFDLFPELESYIGKYCEVRGWIHKHKNHYSMLVRHPSAIKPQDNHL